MNKKIILAVGGIVLLIVAIIVAAVVKNTFISPENGKSSDTKQTDSAVNNAEFDLVYSERLAGYPATDYSSTSSTVKVKFSDKGYILKTYSGSDKTKSDKEFTETTEKEIDRMKVTFKGENGKVWLAEWNYNNFAYTICISSDVEGVSAEDMMDYVKETR